MRVARSWILVPEGQEGNKVQCEGVAQALGVTPHVKYVSPPTLGQWLTQGVFHLLGPYAPPFLPSGFGPPWPSLLLASGGRVGPVARAIGREAQNRCFVAFFQSPVVSSQHFDFVWAPTHDHLTGKNVFTTLLSPHRITPESLAVEAAKWLPEFAHLPRPWIAVLVGGANSAYQFSRRDVSTLCVRLREALSKTEGSLLVVGSSRTGSWRLAQIRQELDGLSAFIWDHTPPNPYVGVLGLADFIVVTADSVNMLGEALCTYASVYAFVPEGQGGKFTRFLGELVRRDLVRPFRGVLMSWQRDPVNDTLRIAEALETSWREKMQHDPS